MTRYEILTKKTPKPLKDETLIHVYSALGAHCGSFVWPTNSLFMLEEMNPKKAGYNFGWKIKK